MKTGQAVTYIDEVGDPHEALVTSVFDNGMPDVYPNPTINIVYVSSDETKTDSYGRQIERASSVQHQSNTTAHGRYWK